MSLNLLRAFGTREIGKAADAATVALGNLDPEGLSDAQLTVMEQDLQRLGVKVAHMQGEAKQATAAYTAENDLNNQRLHAAENQQAKLATASDADKPGIQNTINVILAQAEASHAQLVSDKAAMDDTNATLAELQKVYDTKAAALKNARSNLAQKRHELELAKAHDEAAREHKAMVEDAAGIHPGANHIDTAMQAFQKGIDQHNEAAAAARMEADALSPSSPEKDDPAVAAAMAEAAGKSAPANMSVADRIAALKAA